ncbi:sugar ABC transporter substrate-binding protein [Salipaludibacillus keqinensis]|uniref:Sugar ABC transporter substrate-binding protein n=2 Tax=Salipaludibacillus keqinensis TaxID=2045207 RepID=A0A323TDA7_9BACI|nr:sugar ABC transporter substrate-binding protein [Salipaludibacillus keqinensis]
MTLKSNSMKWFFFMCMFLVLVLAACGGNNNDAASGNEEATAEESNNNDSNNNDGNSNAADSGEAVEIEFWTMQLSPDFDDYINGVIEKFEDEHENVTVNWVDVPWGDMETRILSAVAGGTAPDVANLNPQFAAQLAELDGLVNVEELIDPEVKDQYFEGAWISNSFDGKTFGVPWYLSSQVTMYNADIFEQAGLDPEDPPSTFEELYDVAEQIKEETGKYGYFPPFDGSHVLEALVMMGVDLTNEEITEAAFNTPEGLEAFEYFTNLYQNELIPREVLTEGHAAMIDMYQGGQLAIMASGPQFLSQIETNAPDIFEVTRPAPQITGETGLMNIAAMNLVIPEGTEYTDEALDFAVFMTNAENQTDFSKETAILPSIETALDEPFFQEMEENPTPEEEARVVSASQLPDSEVLIPPMENYEDLRVAMVEALESAMFEQQSPQEALDQAEEQWNQILAQ